MPGREYLEVKLRAAAPVYTRAYVETLEGVYEDQK